MSIYDILMTTLILALGGLFVLNHRAGWLTARIMDAPRRYERLARSEPRRLLMDSEDQQHDPA